MVTKIPVKIGKLEALILANKSLLKLGKVKELDDNKLIVSGSMRYGLQRIKINISIIEEEQVMLKIKAEGDDIWEKGASSAINKLISEIKPSIQNAQPESLTKVETRTTSKIDNSVVEETSNLETNANQIHKKNNQGSSTFDKNIEHREIKSPKKSGNKPNNYRYYIGIACFLVVVIYYFKVNQTNERNANETKWTSDSQVMIEEPNLDQLPDDAEKLQIIDKKKIKWMDFEIHTSGDGLNNLYDLKSKRYKLSEWYDLTYRKGINPAIIVTADNVEVEFPTFSIDELTDQLIDDELSKKIINLNSKQNWVYLIENFSNDNLNNLISDLGGDIYIREEVRIPDTEVDASNILRLLPNNKFYYWDCSGNDIEGSWDVTKSWEGSGTNSRSFGFSSTDKYFLIDLKLNNGKYRKALVYDIRNNGILYITDVTIDNAPPDMSTFDRLTRCDFLVPSGDLFTESFFVLR